MNEFFNLQKLKHIFLEEIPNAIGSMKTRKPLYIKSSNSQYNKFYGKSSDDESDYHSLGEDDEYIVYPIQSHNNNYDSINEDQVIEIPEDTSVFFKDIARDIEKKFQLPLAKSLLYYDMISSKVQLYDEEKDEELLNSDTFIIPFEHPYLIILEQNQNLIDAYKIEEFAWRDRIFHVYLKQGIDIIIEFVWSQLKQFNILPKKENNKAEESNKEEKKKE